jgi:putative transcriptional regulator
MKFHINFKEINVISSNYNKFSEDEAKRYISQLKDGSILLSREMLEDPNFKNTLVLVCMYKSDGIFGLVCNRPSHMPLSEVFNVDSIYKYQKRNIYIGGPCRQETLHIIQITDKAANHAYKVGQKVFLGGEWESLEAILAEDISTTRLFLGYSGWAPGQLEDEIKAGAWEVYNVDLNKFLMQWKEPLYTDTNESREYLLNISQ